MFLCVVGSQPTAIQGVVSFGKSALKDGVNKSKSCMHLPNAPTGVQPCPLLPCDSRGVKRITGLINTSSAMPASSMVKRRSYWVNNCKGILILRCSLAFHNFIIAMSRGFRVSSCLFISVFPIQRPWLLSTSPAT
jgi:hypothetical protein